MLALPALMHRLRTRAPLALIVLAGFAWTTFFVLQLSQYFVQPDELEYIEQALRIGEQGHPLVPRDRFFTSWAQLQPVLMAPAWTLLGANDAFRVQHVLNAAIVASTAIPGYLLALRVTAERRAALLVAFLCVAIPWIAMAATMLTEVSAYPAFLWAVLALQHAVARPSARGDLIGIAGIALALTARPQFLVLAPTFVAAALVHEARYAAAGQRRTPGRRLRAAVGHHPILVPVAVVGLLGLLAGSVTSRRGFLGTYSAAANGDLVSPGAFDQAREALSYVAVGVGVLPLLLALAFVLATLWRPATPERHAFALVGLLASAGLVLAVGSFSVRFTGGINSRYVFYVAPLLLVGTAALLTERRRMPAALLAGGALGAWLVHEADLALRGPSLVSPDSAFHDVLFGRIGQIEALLGLRDFPAPRVLAVGAFVAVVGFVVARARGRRAAANIAVVVAVTGWCAVETTYCLKKIADTQADVDQAFIDTRSWIDAELPEGLQVPVLISVVGDRTTSLAVWWDVNFWNKSVTRTVITPSADVLEQPFPEQITAEDTGRIVGFEESIFRNGLDFGPSGYVVRAATDRRFGFREARVVKEQGGVQILRSPVPARLSWALIGGSDSGVLTPENKIELLVFGRPRSSRRVRMVLTALPEATGPQRLTIRGAGVDTSTTVPRRGARTVTVTAAVLPKGNSKLRIRVAGRSPAGVQVQRVATSAAPGRTR